MPRENRKRGKRHKKAVQNEQEPADLEVYEGDGGYRSEDKVRGFEDGDRPSWVVRDRDPQVNTEAPFGYVDADVKAYFRTVELQIRDWQENPAHVNAGYGGDDGNEQDPNEGIFLCFPSSSLLTMSRSASVSFCCLARNVGQGTTTRNGSGLFRNTRTNGILHG